MPAASPEPVLCVGMPHPSIKAASSPLAGSVANGQGPSQLSASWEGYRAPGFLPQTPCTPPTLQGAEITPAPPGHRAVAQAPQSPSRSRLPPRCWEEGPSFRELWLLGRQQGFGPDPWVSPGRSSPGCLQGQVTVSTEMVAGVLSDRPQAAGMSSPSNRVLILADLGLGWEPG